MRPPPSHLLASIVAATITFAAPALAAWPHEPHNGGDPLSSFASHQAFPRTIPDGAGGAFIAWHEARATFDVYVQHVRADGATTWGASGVAVCSAVGEQSNAMLAPDGAGGVIVVWHDSRSGGAFDIYAQRLNAAGVPQWTTNGVAICTATGDQSNPQIVSDGAGGAIITWPDARGANKDIFAQRVNAAGTPLWLANGVSVCSATFDQVAPVAVSDGAGGAIVAWTDFRSGIADIYAQRLHPNGTPMWVGNGNAVSTATAGQYEVSIVADGDGGAILAWTHERSGLDSDIRCQRLSANGSFLWPANGALAASADTDEFLSQVTSDGVGGAIVVWQSVVALDFTDLHAQRLNAGGIAQWGAGVLVCGAAGSQSAQCIASDGSGGAIIGWMDPRYGALDVFAQRIDANGSGRWQANGTPVSTANQDQANPTLVADGTGGAILAWHDVRNGESYRVYAQRIERYGQLGDPAARITSVRDTPNDQGGRVKVSWSASYLDVDPTYGVTRYRLWRSAPASTATALVLAGERTTTDADEAAATGKWLVLPDADAATATAYAWELVEEQVAATLPSYSAITATLGDSATASNPRTAFMVEARGGDDLTSPRWFSAPDSGYSVDNLAPAMPAPFSAVTSDGAHHLDWGANAEADLAGYRIYRGVTPGFVPSAVTLLAEQAGTGFVDPTSYAYFYKLSAVDVHGNESAYASLATAGTTDVEDGDRPATLRLAVPEPNPARARTRVQFDLTQRAFVSLMVFDAGGRAVRVLTRGVREAGRFGTTWDLCDDAGREVPSGLYFVRLETAGRTLVRRIVAMR